MFSHLHVHSEYSLLDGVNRIYPLVAKIKELGMTSCAITDHANMYGVFKFYNEMKNNGLKPILGCELNVAPRSHHEKVMGIDNKYFHLTVLAKNLIGYKNLMKLVSIGNMEGYYFKPRVDLETLFKHSEGLIVLSGCLSGILSRRLQNNQTKEALEIAKQFKEVFKENFFIEIQRLGIKEQDTINLELLKISKDLNIDVVATYDAHYLEKGDDKIQEILWCISDGKTLDDPTRRIVNTNQSYIKTEAEALEDFKDLKIAIDNTQKIVDMIEEYDITFGRLEPNYDDIPKGYTSKNYLREIVLEGAKNKYGEVTDELIKRIDYELEIINDKGYNNYFLVVWDFVKFCNEKKIMVSARGSAVGSVVGYSLNIGNVDPIKWGLYFERFLNPGRNSPPDVDLDLSDNRRFEVIKYAQEKYGRDNVKQIITFSKLQTRQAIRDVSRVLGIDLVTADKLSKLVKVEFGKTKPIDYMMEHNPEFADLINSNDKTKQMSEIVKKIAGLARGVSMHACGVIIAPTPVVDYTPVQPDSKKEDVGMSQYEMNDIEPIGLLKLDFLGLRNLSIIDNALRKIERKEGEPLNLEKIDTEDQKVYENLESGHTIGVFQLESDGMTKALMQIDPKNPEDICYLLAAYRPGPIQFIPDYVAVKKGDKKIEYLLPELESILSVTNGVITYQEQVMKIAADIAGYTLSEADNMRRAMGKKKMEIMVEEIAKFVEGGKKKGFAENKLKELGELLIKFANYGFNKSHAAAYAMISYYTAYLKTYYPLEYMAALLEADLGRFDDVIKDTLECSRMGIDILPPHINKSGLYFTVEEGKENKSIRFGMGSIKNVGGDIVKNIVKERDENGIYSSLDDLIFRLIDKKFQLKTCEYLIMSGAMDEFGDRQALISILPQIYERAKKSHLIASQGQIDLFIGNSNTKITLPQTQIPQDIKTPVHQILHWEKDLLGLYFSSHPLDNLQEFFVKKGSKTILEIKNGKPNSLVILGCLITNVKRITTKKDERMAFLTVEDKTGSIDVLVFPRTYEELKDTFEANKPILIAGKLSARDNTLSIILEKCMYVNEEKFSSDFKGVIIKITNKHKEKEIKELKEYILKNPGDTPVKVITVSKGESKTIDLRNGINITNEGKALIQRFS